MSMRKRMTLLEFYEKLIELGVEVYDGWNNKIVPIKSFDNIHARLEFHEDEGRDIWIRKGFTYTEVYDKIKSKEWKAKLPKTKLLITEKI